MFDGRSVFLFLRIRATYFLNNMPLVSIICDYNVTVNNMDINENINIARSSIEEEVCKAIAEEDFDCGSLFNQDINIYANTNDSNDNIKNSTDNKLPRDVSDNVYEITTDEDESTGSLLNDDESDENIYAATNIRFEDDNENTDGVHGEATVDDVYITTDDSDSDSLFNDNESTVSTFSKIV